MTQRVSLSAHAALVALMAVTASPSLAQDYKYAPPTPPGIASPDTVETRLGTLRFFDGFPDKPTIEKLYDNLDFQRAVQAYLLGLPAVSQAANLNNMRTLGPTNSTLPIYEQPMNSRSINLTANNNTPYTWVWVDLHDGPVVLEVPPKVLGLINDMWFRWVVDVGITGPDKGAGGKYLMLPPGYKGEVPDGYTVVRSPTFNWIPWRSFLVDGDLKPGVDLVKKFTKIYPLSKAANPPAMNVVNLYNKAFNTVAPADYTF